MEPKSLTYEQVKAELLAKDAELVRQLKEVRELRLAHEANAAEQRKMDSQKVRDVYTSLMQRLMK